MNIVPKDGAAIVPVNNAKTEVPTSARERAIAALTKTFEPANNIQDLPVRNATSVQPEEMSALKTSRQVGNSEAPEAPATAAPEAKPELLSTHYANLARMQKQIRAEQIKLQQEREAMKASQAAKPAESIDTSKFVSREDLLKDPFSVLNDLGLTYDQLTQSALNQPKPEELAIRKMEAELRAELNKLKAAQEEASKNAVEQQNRSYQQALDQIRNETKNLVSGDKDAYEAILSTNSINDVVDLIETTYKEEGILMSVEDAAREVEEYLIEEAIKIARMKKIQNKLVNTPIAPPKSVAPAVANAQMKTLTNNVSSTRPLSAKERAILAFKGELKE